MFDGRDTRVTAVNAVRQRLHCLHRATPLAPKIWIPLVAMLLAYTVSGVAAAAPLLLGAIEHAERRRVLDLAEILAFTQGHREIAREEVAVQLLKVAQSDPTIRRIRLYRVGPDRLVLWASSRPAEMAEGTTDPMAEARDGQRAVAFEGEAALETIVVPPREGIAVQVYSSLEALRAEGLEILGRVGAAAVLGLFLLLAVVRVVLERTVLGPIGHIDRAARRVGAGDLDLDLGDADTPPARDEIVSISREFARMVRSVAEQRAGIEQIAATDALTGLLNRRAFDARLRLETDRARRLGYGLVLSLIDLDGFKGLNDTAGHPAGDAALRRVAAAIAGAVRASDVVARYGGDEFAVIHPACDIKAALTLGARTRAAVEALAIPTGREPRRLLSASVGAAALVPGAADGLVGAADAALYRAKARGGGVEASDPEVAVKPA